MNATFLLAGAFILLVIAVGGALLLAAVLDYRDARALAAHGAAKLISWAETEAAVLQAEARGLHEFDFKRVEPPRSQEEVERYVRRYQEAAHG